MKFVEPRPFADFDAADRLVGKISGKACLSYRYLTRWAVYRRAKPFLSLGVLDGLRSGPTQWISKSQFSRFW